MRHFTSIPDVELPEELVDLAERIMEAKVGRFDPGVLEDRYRTVLKEMIRERRPESTPMEAPLAPPRQNVLDLMAALKKSLGTETAARSPSSKKSPATTRAVAKNAK